MQRSDAIETEDIFQNAIRHSPLAIVLTDPRLDDNPITYVNRAFEELTLYSRSFAIGRNCRFLQGPATDARDIEKLKKGLESQKEFQVTLTNHKADGIPFRNQLLIAPIHGAGGELTAYFGLLREIQPSQEVERWQADDKSLDLLMELQHRVKNHLAMIVGLIRVQARKEVTADSLRAISRRIEALSVLYDELLNGPDAVSGSRDVAAGAYLSRIASVISSLEPRGAIRVNVECEDITLSVDQSARLGLLLSELMTNAFEHAFEDRSSGFLEIRFHRLDDGRVRLSVEDDGKGMPKDSNWPFAAPSIEAQRDRAEHTEGQLDTTGHDAQPGVGGSIVAALTESLGAELSVANPARGTIVTIDL